MEVLVIEGSDERYAAALLGAGFQVARSRRDGVLAALRSKELLAMLADVSLTDTETMELVWRAHQLRRDVPIVAIGDTSDATVRALERGAAQSIVAPSDPALLVRVVQVAVERRNIGRRPTIGKKARSVSSTDAKNELASILDTVGQGPVYITKHDAPRAVVLAYDDYERLTVPDMATDPRLADVYADLEQMFADMQTPAHRAAWQGLMDATPDQLGEAWATHGKRR
ncbi:MAG TPA: type II toxin-antitoxin system prevent-host-death family antitoxin [Kofleriaceae bacterium]|jgi:prevent-host-death family protein